VEQPDLFLGTSPAPTGHVRRRALFADTPRARESDPSTSHAAAAHIKASGVLGFQQQQVLEYVKLWPGHTSNELAARIAVHTGTKPEEHRWMIARRLPELRGPHVRNGHARECTITDRQALTWWPAATVAAVQEMNRDRST